MLAYITKLYSLLNQFSNKAVCYPNTLFHCQCAEDLQKIEI